MIRQNRNKILSIKKCFIYVKKDKGSKEDFEELNFEAESES